MNNTTKVINSNKLNAPWCRRFSRPSFNERFSHSDSNLCLQWSIMQNSFVKLSGRCLLLCSGWFVKSIVGNIEALSFNLQAASSPRAQVDLGFLSFSVGPDVIIWRIRACVNLTTFASTFTASFRLRFGGGFFIPRAIQARCIDMWEWVRVGFTPVKNM